MTVNKRLHIGGKIRSDGWEVLNVLPGPCVDYVCNANNLSLFEDNTFAEIYASHIVEHFDYQGELTNTLKEWNRVLICGGRVYVSVPNMDVLAKLLLSGNKLTFDERFFVMRMLFGGHVNEHDYHVVGLNEEFLTHFLLNSGYVNIKRVENFGLFDDASSMTFKGVPISLNVIAEKPHTSE